MCWKVLKNGLKIIVCCNQSTGGHLEDIVSRISKGIQFFFEVKPWENWYSWSYRCFTEHNVLRSAKKLSQNNRLLAIGVYLFPFYLEIVSRISKGNKSFPWN